MRRQSGDGRLSETKKRSAIANTASTRATPAPTLHCSGPTIHFPAPTLRIPRPPIDFPPPTHRTRAPIRQAGTRIIENPDLNISSTTQLAGSPLIVFRRLRRLDLALFGTCVVCGYDLKRARVQPPEWASALCFESPIALPEALGTFRRSIVRYLR